MSAVEVAVNRITRIGGVESLGVVVAETEIVDILCETVDVVVTDHRRLELEKLVLKHELVPVRAENHFAIAHASDLELEAWTVTPYELKVAACGSGCSISDRKRGEVWREDIKRAVLGSDILWVHLDAQALLCLVLNN